MILLGVIFVQRYHQGVNSIDDDVKNQMKICSFDLKCEGLSLDFVPKSKTTKTRQLYKKGDLYTFFDVPTADGYMLKVILPQKDYQLRIKNLKKELFKDFFIYSLLIALLSFLFSLYSLRPLQNALKLNEEFVKDILHDINTPLSSLVVNFKLFKKDIGQNRKIERMETNIATILSLQNNLRAFLDESVLQKESISLESILRERINYFQTLYPQKSFSVDIRQLDIEANKDAFVRIIDNLISNACKYSDLKGEIKVVGENDQLRISDNGQGIKNVKKVFKRYYKENQRGIGIGLHVVKKLCDAIGIDISIQSQVGKGTTVVLHLSKVILK